MTWRNSGTPTCVAREAFLLDRESKDELSIRYLDLMRSDFSISFRTTLKQVTQRRLVEIVKCFLILQSLSEEELEKATTELKKILLSSSQYSSEFAPFTASEQVSDVKISEQQAQALANEFLSNNLPDRFICNEIHLSEIENAWIASVVLAYPFVGSLGEVGTVAISTTSEAILSYTPIKKMKQIGQELYELHGNAIQAHFL